VKVTFDLVNAIQLFETLSKVHPGARKLLALSITG